MSHNTANTIAFVVWCSFIAVLAIFISAWFVLLVFHSPSFKTDKELEYSSKQPKDKLTKKGKEQ